ncbi:MAG: HAMP domain-containing protein, partial [Thermodesulfobacteriota bacterium]
MKIKTLKQRLVLFLIVPVAFILFGTGFFGFIYVRKILMDQWQESAVLRLQRAAHQIDMRLTQPIGLIEMIGKSRNAGTGDRDWEWLMTQLKAMDGVTDANLKWNAEPIGNIPKSTRNHGHDGHMGMRFQRTRISEVTHPKYDASTGQETVMLISELRDQAEQLIGTLEVSVRFDYLMQDIIDLGWWQSELACLVDESGTYLAHTKEMKGRMQLGDMKDHLELAVLEEMKKKPFGTVITSGHPPDMISGFYRISHAPWILIMFAPGDKILAPILEFRFYYILAGIGSIILILLFIRFVGGNMVQSIRDISSAAAQVAKGDYSRLIPVKRMDELGRLAVSFNEMIEGLKEKEMIENTFGRYIDKDIARTLIRRPEAARLGGKKREVAMLMSDIRGFTALSESLTPEQTITILNNYLSHMIQVIRDPGGIIVDFFGDGLLAFFDPLDEPVPGAA